MAEGKNVIANAVKGAVEKVKGGKEPPKEVSCDSIGRMVTWEPYRELKEFVRNQAEKRISYFFFIDTEDGAKILNEVSYELANWERKFAFLQNLPMKQDARVCMNAFKNICKDNAFVLMIRNLLFETRDVLIMQSKLDADAKSVNISTQKKEEEDLVEAWEQVRCFLYGMKIFKDDLEEPIKVGDLDGSDFIQAELKKAEEAATAGTKTDCWVKKHLRGWPSLPTACPNAAAQLGRMESGVASIDKKSGANEKSFSDDTHTSGGKLRCYPPCNDGYYGSGPVCF